jgi:predicted aldo/keto reductase-like oxidoreductase
MPKRSEMMKRMVLGKTGIETNRLGFGGIPIQRVDEDQAVRTVLHAIESGVDLIDTSRAYTTSERRIGLALKQTDKKVCLATKSYNRTADLLRTDIETSLHELGVDYIDLYQCHFVKNEQDYEQVIGPNGALEGMLRARDEGLIGHVGLTSHSLEVLHRAVRDGLFETIMVCFGILEPKAQEELIPEALAQRMGVLAMKPLAGGVIDNAPLALKWALSHPGILVLAGVEDPGLFDENWAVFQGDWQLRPEEEAEIAALRKAFDKNFCRRCDYCQPCTEEIPIQMILGIRSQVKRMGAAILTRSPRKDSIAKARNCSGCEQCMERCPYGLPIPELIKENLRWIDEQVEKEGRDS